MAYSCAITTNLKKRVSVGLKRLSWKYAKREEMPGSRRTTSSRKSRLERRKMLAAYVTKGERELVKDSASTPRAQEASVSRLNLPNTLISSKSVSCAHTG